MVISSPNSLHCCNWEPQNQRIVSMLSFWGVKIALLKLCPQQYMRWDMWHIWSHSLSRHCLSPTLSSGHFLMYDTMHQIYATWGYDTSKYPDVDGGNIQLWGSYVTDKSQSVDWQILQMVLALKYKVYAHGTFLIIIGLSYLPKCSQDAFGDNHWWLWWSWSRMLRMQAQQTVIPKYKGQTYSTKRWMGKRSWHSQYARQYYRSRNGHGWWLRGNYSTWDSKWRLGCARGGNRYMVSKGWQERFIVVSHLFKAMYILIFNHSHNWILQSCTICNMDCPIKTNKNETKYYIKFIIKFKMFKNMFTIVWITNMNEMRIFILVFVISTLKDMKGASGTFCFKSFCIYNDNVFMILFILLIYMVF